MITIVTRDDSQTAVRDYLYGRGGGLRRRLKTLAYEKLLGKRRLKAQTVIFADLERLDPSSLHRAAQIRSRLDAAGVLTLNDPARSMRRYQLLRSLHDAGLNPFNVCPAAEPRPAVRFPVFLREESEHSGAASELLRNPDELNDALRRMEEIGRRRDTHLIVEYCDTRCQDGRFRKYGAFRIGGRIVPRHLLFSREWEIKDGTAGYPPELAEEELAYVRDNPHAEALMKIFRMAGIEYGRIDYSLKDGRPVVWEINTNPMLGAVVITASSLRGRQQELYRDSLAAAFTSVDDRPLKRVKLSAVRRPIETPLLAKRFLMRRFPRARPLLIRLGKKWRPLLERVGLPPIDKSKPL